MEYDDLKAYSNQKNSYMRHSGVTILSSAPDRVTAQAVVGPNSLNVNGYLHGGVYFTLADASSGVLCRTDGREYVTECADIRYLKGVREGTIFATATLLRRGRRSCVVQTEITDEQGTRLAVFTANFACVSDTRLRQP